MKPKYANFNFALKVYQAMNEKMIVLVKGSRSMKMEEVVSMLMVEAEGEINQANSKKVNN